MLSRISYIFCSALILYVAFIFYPKWENKAGETSLGWDAATYYWYLPATFIYKDLKKQRFSDSIMEKYQFIPNYEPFIHSKSGNVVITYSSGLAFMHLPAFALAHFLAEPLGYPADGFSLPYQVLIQIWSIVAVLIGLWFFRKLLLLFFSDITVTIILALLVIGTNFLNYAAIDVTLTHSWLFTIITLLMLSTEYFYREPRCRYALSIGFLTGLAILIRPSEILVAILPLFWGLENISKSSLRQRIQFLINHYKPVLLAISMVLLVGSIQVAYWLFVTGEPLVYSYDDKGFSWLNPHFFNYTFSYRSGWLVYTPLMFFIFWALIIHFKYGKNKVALFGFFFLNYYLVSAWDIWWYGGMGGRAMVQSYAVAFLIMGTLIEWLLKAGRVKWPSFALMGLLSYVNIWFTYNAHAGQGLYDPTGMTKSYFWAVVGRFKVPQHTAIYKDTDEYFSGKPKNIKLIYDYGFEDDTTYSEINPIFGRRSLNMHSNMEYSNKLQFKNNISHATWLRAKVSVRTTDREWENWRMIQFIVGFTQNGKKIKDRMIRINRYAEPGQIVDVSFDIKVPKENFDSIYIYFWNPGSQVGVDFDNIEISSFTE